MKLDYTWNLKKSSSETEQKYKGEKNFSGDLSIKDY